MCMSRHARKQNTNRQEARSIAGMQSKGACGTPGRAIGKEGYDQREIIGDWRCCSVFGSDIPGGRLGDVGNRSETGKGAKGRAGERQRE